MDKYFMVCAHCGKRTQITEREAKAYAFMRMISGSEGACINCGGAVIGDIVSTEQKEATK